MVFAAIGAAALVISGAACAQSPPLAGTSWTVVKVQGVGVPPGLSLTFTADRVNGSTGCNQFWAPVEYLNAPAIDIGAPQSRRQYCLGAMSIERAYLASLETVESYQINGDTLKMMMHDGDVFLEMKAAAVRQGP